MARRYGVFHKEGAVSRRASRSRIKRKLHVKVDVERSVTGHFHAIACVTGLKAPYLGKGAHCSGLRGGTTPTKAAAHALQELGQAMEKYGR